MNPHSTCLSISIGAVYTVGAPAGRASRHAKSCPSTTMMVARVPKELESGDALNKAYRNSGPRAGSIGTLQVGFHPCFGRRRADRSRR